MGLTLKCETRELRILGGLKQKGSQSGEGSYEHSGKKDCFDVLHMIVMLGVVPTL